MAASDRDEIVAALRKEEGRVSAGVQQARAKAKTLEAELKDVRLALAALTGQPNRVAKKKANPEAKPSATNGEVKQPREQRRKQVQKAPSKPHRSPNKSESG